MKKTAAQLATEFREQEETEAKLQLEIIESKKKTKNEIVPMRKFTKPKEEAETEVKSSTVVDEWEVYSGTRKAKTRRNCKAKNEVQKASVFVKERPVESSSSDSAEEEESYKQW